MDNQPITLKVSVRDVLFGRNVKVIEPTNVYGCEIGDDSFGLHPLFRTRIDN